MPTYRTMETACPICKHKFDVATSLENNCQEFPKENDLAVCAGCGEFLCFNLDLALRPANENDLAELTSEQLQECKEAQQFIRRRRQ